MDPSTQRSVPNDGAGSLPFTGYDALGVGGVGLLLAGIGLSLRFTQRRYDMRS